MAELRGKKPPEILLNLEQRLKETGTRF